MQGGKRGSPRKSALQTSSAAPAERLQEALSSTQQESEPQEGCDRRCLESRFATIRITIGDRQPRTMPTKDIPYQVVFWGLVCELSEPKRKAKYASPPSFALVIFILDFVGVVRRFRGPTLPVCNDFKLHDSSRKLGQKPFESLLRLYSFSLFR